ncbi:MAG: Rne/Rng family ribonuclease [Terriglobia bacterium]
MTKELLVSSSPHETKVAMLEDDQVVEVYFQRDTDVGLVGGIYKGRVNRVLPGMQSAFVNIGLERDAFLYVSDFYEDSEEYDRVFTEAEERLPSANGEATAIPRSAVNAPAPPLEENPPSEPERPETAERAPEAAPPLATTPRPAEPSRPASGPQDFERREFGGPRRRRGRRFRTSRFAPRHEADERRPVSRPEQREDTAPQVFEVLPGESLARHRSESAPELHAPSLSEPEAPEPPASITASEAFETPTLASAPEPPPQSAAAIFSSGAAEPEAPPSGEAVPSWGEPEGERLETEPHPMEPPDVAPIAYEELSGSDSGEFPEAEGAPENEEPVGDQPSAPPENASYSLHDSQQHPHVAPRQERRGRGRFRNRFGRRRETGTPPGREALRSATRPLPINDLLKEGQEILVQIAKEPLGTKGARITSHIALPGRYLVYMPTIDHIGVSRKIASDEERLRLRNLLLEHKGSLPGGFIVRTAGAGRSDDEIKADIAFLTRLWNDIRAKAERAKAPALLHRDLTLVERILRDLLSPAFRSIRVDSEIEYEHILEFVSRFQPALTGSVKLYTRAEPMFEEFGIQAEIDKALRPKVWLKSGGYIVINQTEALVAIDVNTGKYVGKTNRLEDTIVKTNIDAIKEIVRQIRLRDLGGIIVIDFIDMDERRNRTRVVQALEDALRQDRAPTKILSFNEFGLVALTRKRVKHSLERALCEPCPYCSGAGWIKSVATVSNEILAEARKMASQVEGKALNLRVHPLVAAALKARDGVLLSEIESSTGKDVTVKSDSDVHQERFEIF